MSARSGLSAMPMPGSIRAARSSLLNRPHVGAIAIYRDYYMYAREQRAFNGDTRISRRNATILASKFIGSKMYQSRLKVA